MSLITLKKPFLQKIKAFDKYFLEKPLYNEAYRLTLVMKGLTSMNKYPQIYLALDNCFASKRWTSPDEWSRLMAKMGVYRAEASADNECDPLYMDSDYLKDWVRAVAKAESETGVKTANLYSGHGTYTTLGLAHADVRVRDRMQNRWLKPLMNSAKRLDAGIGFFCHAFSEQVLQSPPLYAQYEEDLYSRLGQLAAYWGAENDRYVSIEQMYTPHQIPWTVSGAKKLIKSVYERSGAPMYITIDSGHQSAQRHYIKPEKEQLAAISDESVWTGPEICRDIIKRVRAGICPASSGIEQIAEEIERFPFLFADYNDGDTYYWLSSLAAYSPIIHLQQTAGSGSHHLGFTAKNNAVGIIEGKRVLKAIAESYNQAPDPDMPPRCKEIHLTLELFFSTESYPADIISDIRESAAYWRTFIPRDGMRLDELLKLI